MIKKIWRHKNLKESFWGALRGLKIVLKTERNARVIFSVGILVIIATVFLNFSLKEVVTLIIMVISVFICEVFNTLVENILDIIRPQDDPHIKILKDLASAAVLLACLGALAVGIMLFLPKILSL